MLLATCAVVGAIVLMTIGLAHVEFRRIPEDLFRCPACGALFAHRGRPRRRRCRRCRR